MWLGLFVWRQDVPVHIFNFHLIAQECNVNRSMYLYMSTRGRGGTLWISSKRPSFSDDSPKARTGW